MSNTMYLVCTHHPDRVHSFRLASRGTALRYLLAARVDRKLEEWLDLHADCGGGCDHFTIAFDLAKDHDIPKQAPLADAVHKTLITPRLPQESESTKVTSLDDFRHDFSKKELDS